jgi:hypothetical protein
MFHKSGAAAAISQSAMVLALAIGLAGAGSTAVGAMPLGAGVELVGGAGGLPVHQARSIFQKMFDGLADDGYVHDDHYDWQAYRDSTSRKDRVKDFYRMQTEMQRDAIRGQLQAQKKMIKAQRGW